MSEETRNTKMYSMIYAKFSENKCRVFVYRMIVSIVIIGLFMGLLVIGIVYYLRHKHPVRIAIDHNI
jgi:hypothetical protein